MTGMTGLFSRSLLPFRGPGLGWPSIRYADYGYSSMFAHDFPHGLLFRFYTHLDKTGAQLPVAPNTRLSFLAIEGHKIGLLFYAEG